MIDQARANQKKAERDVISLTSAHNAAIANQRRAQNTIISVENRIVQIKSALEGLEDLIDKLRVDISEKEAQKSELDRER